MRSRLILLGGQAIALGLMTAFLVVPVSALFLDEYGAVSLPYVYLAVAGAGIVVSWAMSRAERRLSLAGLAVAVLATYLAAVTAGWIVLLAADRLWVTFPMLVLFPLSIPIGFVLVGSEAGRLLDVRQMKAYFPRVAAGFPVGFAGGGLVAAALVAPLGDPRHLLPFCVASAGAMLGLIVIAARRFPNELAAAPEPMTRAVASGGRRRRGTWWVLLGNRMVVLILAYQLLSAAVTQLLDYMVWERAAARYPDPSDLAQFQGLFGAVINVVSVLFVVAFAGWLLTRFGIGFGLAANPLGVLVLLVASAAAGYATGAAALTFFVLVCAQQVTDISLTDGTTRTSIAATYQALQPDDRVRAQTMVEGAGVPLALGFVGVLLIVFDALALDIRAVVLVTLVLTAGWLVAAVLAFREYGVNLRGVLTRRAWDPVALRLDDAASHAAVTSLLESADPSDVHTALDALVDAGHDVSEPVLSLLQSPDAARRLMGIEVSVATGQLTVPVVTDHTHELLADPDPEVALSAAAALVRLRAGAREAGRTAWLGALAADDPMVVRRALRAAALVPHNFFVPYLVGLAAAERASADLLDALSAHRDHLAWRVKGLLGDLSVPRQTRERLVHFLGQAATPEARDLLVEHLDDGDQAIVEAAATCLVAVGHRESPEKLDLGPKLHLAAERADRSLQVLLLLQDRPDHEPLRIALSDEVDAAARRVEVLLELVHDARAVGSAVSELSSSVERSRSTALEMLEVTVGRGTARMTQALVDPTMDDASRQRALAVHTERSAKSLAGWLHEVIVDEDGYWRDPWLRACALYAVPGEVSASEAVALGEAFADDLDRDVAETARWVTSTQ